MSTQTIVIPFSGFYESLHDSELDYTLDSMFSDRATGCDVNDGLRYRAWDGCNWGAVWHDYAQAYAEQFAKHFELDGLTFESLQSPREYNFTTDRIFCNITTECRNNLMKKTPREAVEKMAREMFTSRDGFSSFYSPDVSTWGKVGELDHNQLACILAAYVDHVTGEEFDSWKELELMENAGGNGDFDNMIAEHTTGIDRLYRVHDYLENRNERNQ